MKKSIAIIMFVLMMLLTGCVHDVQVQGDDALEPSNVSESTQAADVIEPSDEPKSAQTDDTVNPPVQIIKAAYSSMDKDWYVKTWVTVRIENISEKPIDSLELKATTYDENGKLFEVYGDTSVLLRVLLDGELVPRRTCSYDAELPLYNRRDIVNGPRYMELCVYRCGFADGSTWMSEDDESSLRIACNEGWSTNESTNQSNAAANNDKDEDSSEEVQDDKTIAEDFLYEWFDDWSFESGMMNENPVTTFDRLTKYFEPESDAYTAFYDAQDNFSSPFYKNAATCVVGKPMTVEESGNTYRVEIEYLVTQNTVDQNAYDRLLQHATTQAFDITVVDGKVVSVQRV